MYFSMGCFVVARVAHNKLTKEIVNARLKRAGRNVHMIGEYVSTQEKSEFVCELGHKWLATPSSVMSGHGCPHCSKNAKLSKESVNSKLESQGSEIRLVGDYVNARTKTEFICENGHSWMTVPHNVLSGANCPHCSGRAPLTKEKVNQRIAASGRRISLIGDFLTVEDKSEFICENNHIWLATSRSILSGNNCPHCARQAPLNIELINKRLEEQDRGIEIVGDYVNSRTKTNFRCEEGHIWSSSTDNVLAGSGCPHCSRGIDSIYIWRSEGETYNGKNVYKIGITKRSRGVGRLKQCATASGRTLKILRLEKVEDASSLERTLLGFGEKPEYVYKFDGYSEMRALDGKELARVLKLIDNNKETEND